MRFNTPKYSSDPSEAAINYFHSLYKYNYNRKHAKKHIILQSQVFAYKQIWGLQISRKVRVLELRVVLSAYIEMHIAVI